MPFVHPRVAERCETIRNEYLRPSADTLDSAVLGAAAVTLKRRPMAKSSTVATVTETVILVTREGEWLPPEELLAIARSAVETEGNLTVDLEGVDHLDASALQVLLALAAERKKRGKGLRLANASVALSRWFEYAGGGRISLLHVSVNGHA